MTKFMLNVELKPVLLQADLLKIQKQIQNSFQNIKLNGTIDPRMAQALRETEVLVQGLTKTTQRSEAALHRFGRGMIGYFTRFASFTLAASGVFKILSSIGQATDAAIEFDNRLVRLRQITGDTREQLKGLSTESFRLATTFGVSQSKILKAAETLAQAGYNAEQTKGMLQALAKADLSPTFDNMEQTVDGLIATLNQFGVATTKSEDVLSKLNTVAAKFPVESADLISAIQRTGGVFAQSKTSLDEFLALFTAIRSTTRETPETIAQGLKTIVTRIQRVKTSEFLERLGISGIRDASTREFVGAYKAIQILASGIQKFKKGSPELAAITEELGGIRQIGKVLPLLNNFTVAEAAYEASVSSGNSITKDAAIAQESLSVQITKTQEELTKLVTIFFENRAIKGFIKDTLELTRALVGLAEKLEPVLPFLAVIAASRVLRAGAAVTSGALDTLRNVPDATRKLAGHASGGYIPGRSTKDDYPALLMRGEYVVSQKGVDAVGTGFLDRINKGEIPRFASGGKDKKYTRSFNKEVNEEYRRILLEQSNKQLFLSGTLPNKNDEYRKRAERTVLQRHKKRMLEESSRLRELDLTGIDNPIHVSVTETASDRRKKEVEQTAARAAKDNEIQREVETALERSQDVRYRHHSKKVKKYRGVDTGKVYGPQTLIDTLAHEQRLLTPLSTERSVPNILGMAPQYTNEPDFMTAYKAGRARGLTPAEAKATAKNHQQSIPIINPRDNLTKAEKLNLLPLYQAEAKAQLETLKLANTRKGLLGNIVDKTKSLSSSLSSVALEQSEKGWLGLTKPRKFSRKFGRAASLGSIAALLATNTDFFQNSVDGIAGKGIGGATASGAIRGGLTGAATGSVFGPWGIAIGGMVSAIKGASDGLKEFEEALTSKILTNAINDVKEASTMPEKKRTTQAVLGATIYNLDAQMRPSGFSVASGSAALDELSGAKKQRDDELIKSGFSEIQPILQDYIKSAIDSGATSAAEINKKFGKQNIGSEFDFILQKLGVTEVDLFKAISLATETSEKVIEREINARIANQKVIEANKQRLSTFGDQALITSKQLFQFSRVQKQFIDSLPDTKIRTLNSSESFLEDFSGLNKPGTSKFTRDANKLGNSREIALVYNQTYAALENALSNINPDATFAEFSSNLEDSLKIQLGGGLHTNRFSLIIGSILEALGDEEKFNEFSQKLKRGIDEPLNHLLNESGLNQIPQKLQEATQAFSAFNAELLKNTQQLFNGAAELSSGRLNLAQSNLSNRRQIGELLGIGTTAGLDNQLIQNNIASSFGTTSPEKLIAIINNFDKLAQVTGDSRYVEASKYVVSSLTKLGDVSSRTGDILTRINELERIRSARISLKEGFVTGDASSRRELLSNLSAARGFISTGGNEAVFEKLAPRIQKAVVEGLRSYGDIPLYKGKTGNQLADNLLGGTSKEKDGLISALGSITVESEKINTFLVSRMASIQQDFLNQYRATNYDFLSRLDGIMHGNVGPRKFAKGGYVPGNGNQDSVSAMLTPGEFVLPKDAVKAIGLNNVQKFANGGEVRRQKREAYLANKAAKRNAFLASRSKYQLDPSVIDSDADPLESLRLLRNAKRGRLRTQLREHFVNRLKQQREREKITSKTIPISIKPDFGYKFRTLGQDEDIFGDTTPKPTIAPTPSVSPMAPISAKPDVALPKGNYVGDLRSVAERKAAEVAKLDISNLTSQYLSEKHPYDMSNASQFFRLPAQSPDKIDFEEKMKRVRSLLNYERLKERQDAAAKTIPISIPGFASGGFVPGVGNRDSVNAMLMPGEFVLTKDAVKMLGPKYLNQINKLAKRGSIPSKGNITKNSIRAEYADGGLVSSNTSIDVSSLERFNNLFGMNIEKLNKVAEAIPHTISMNVNHRLEIIHNGAQVFETMEKSFVDLAQSLISNEINKLIKTKFPDVGMLS